MEVLPAGRRQRGLHQGRPCDRERQGQGLRQSTIKDKKKKLKEKLRTQCGPPTSSKITVYDRYSKYATEGQKHFTEVLKLWAHGDAEKKIPGANPGERAARE